MAKVLQRLYSRFLVSRFKKINKIYYKPLLEEATLLIIVFKKRYDYDNNGKNKSYYINDPVDTALGFQL